MASIDDAYFFLLFFFITSGPTHCSTNLHHSMHPKSSFGFGTHFLQFLHCLLVSSLKNSINTPHEGHLTSKISPGFQWRVSCPGLCDFYYTDAFCSAKFCQFFTLWAIFERSISILGVFISVTCLISWYQIPLLCYVSNSYILI